MPLLRPYKHNGLASVPMLFGIILPHSKAKTDPIPALSETKNLGKVRVWKSWHAICICIYVTTKPQQPPGGERRQ
jgi:hypothetical protein